MPDRSGFSIILCGASMRVQACGLVDSVVVCERFVTNEDFEVFFESLGSCPVPYPFLHVRGNYSSTHVLHFEALFLKRHR